ncbi:MAG: DUF4340 domain-containing protein [Rhodospirillales bacterium]|nr:DUF4340 domain-containing protein [Rhodospirillales bacterium]
MRARSFLILGAVTLLVGGAAVIAVVGDDRPQSAVQAAGPVLPGLRDRLADVADVVVRDAAQTVTIRRTADGWGVAELGNYPVPPEKVREIVRALVQLEKAEVKTSRADQWSRLSVEDVETAGATSKLVSLRNAAGEVVAQLLIGKSGSGVGAEGSTYVRVPGEPQAWLARGTLTANTKPGDWVDRRLFAIPTGDIQQVRIVHPDKSTVTLIREGDGPNFRLAELPAGGKAKLKRPDELDEIVQALNDMPSEDLAPLAERQFPPSKTIRVTITRTDGSIVAFDVADEGGERWLRFLDGRMPAGLPAAATTMAFQVPAWKLTPLERKLAELIEKPAG